MIPAILVELAAAALKAALSAAKSARPHGPKFTPVKIPTKPKAK